MVSAPNATSQGWAVEIKAMPAPHRKSESWLMRNAPLRAMMPPENSAPTVAALNVRAVRMPIHAGGKPMSPCAAGASTGGGKNAIDHSPWIAIVTISGHTTPFILIYLSPQRILHNTPLRGTRRTQRKEEVDELVILCETCVSETAKFALTVRNAFSPPPTYPGRISPPLFLCGASLVRR